MSHNIRANNFFSELDGGKCPDASTIPKTFQEIRGKYYSYISRSIVSTWEEARQTCQSYGADLLTIKDADDYFAMKLLKRKNSLSCYFM